MARIKKGREGIERKGKERKGKDRKGKDTEKRTKVLYFTPV